MKNQTAIESVLAFEEFRRVLQKDGDVCMYVALKAVIDKDPQGDGYGFVMTARKRFEREFQCVLEVVPNKGVKRATAREVINRGAADIRHVRRSTMRAMQRQVTLVPVERQQSLTREETSVHLAQISYLGVMVQVMKPSSAKKITEASKNVARILPSAEALELFRPKSKNTTAPEQIN